MPKLKIDEAGSLSKYERQKLQRLYTQGAAPYGSVRNLAETSKLPKSKVRQFLHSKDSHTKFTLATRKFKKMRVFARFKIEIWCMDLAYVDKLAKENNGVKYLLVRQDFFDRTVNAKGNENKRLPRNCESLFIHDYRKGSTEKDLGWQGDLCCTGNLLERLKGFVLLRGYKFTPLWVRLRQLLLNVQYDHSKIFFTVA